MNLFIFLTQKLNFPIFFNLTWRKLIDSIFKIPAFSEKIGLSTPPQYFHNVNIDHAVHVVAVILEKLDYFWLSIASKDFSRDGYVTLLRMITEHAWSTWPTQSIFVIYQIHFVQHYWLSFNQWTTKKNFRQP